MKILSGGHDMKVDQELTPEEIYRAVYDGIIGVKAFKAWLSHRLQQAYDQGVYDADSPPSYDDVSRSQYD